MGKNLRVTTGAGADTVNLWKAEVGGATTLRLGDGANNVTINDSLFAGAFALATGADAVNLDMTAGTTAATTFKKAVTITQGAGIDSLTLAGSTDAYQAVVFLSTAVVRHGAEADTLTQNPAQVYFPFGTALQYVA